MEKKKIESEHLLALAVFSISFILVIGGFWGEIIFKPFLFQSKNFIYIFFLVFYQSLIFEGFLRLGLQQLIGELTGGSFWGISEFLTTLFYVIAKYNLNSSSFTLFNALVIGGVSAYLFYHTQKVIYSWYYHAFVSFALFLLFGIV